ncbi:two-component response regulator [Labilithrix luteola]|uniref:Two-component response regulator n=1 Tax=Labilithrix luteola TaxID=1391654 RepID=A0A0K1PNF1_9BACT|nr:response regulator [Labilithrix luteola]AKU95042.1 two-component response regulator [Labilithrix luteola]
MRGALVCIVDDDEAVRRSLCALFRSAGHSVETFASAVDFLASNVLPRTGCLVVDVSMPEITGPELQARLVAECTSPLPLPIIFMSGRADESVRARVLAAGALAFLSKPLDDEVLLTTVEAALDGRERSVAPRA